MQDLLTKPDFSGFKLYEHDDFIQKHKDIIKIEPGTTAEEIYLQKLTQGDIYFVLYHDGDLVVDGDLYMPYLQENLDAIFDANPVPGFTKKQVNEAFKNFVFINGSLIVNGNITDDDEASFGNDVKNPIVYIKNELKARNAAFGAATFFVVGDTTIENLACMQGNDGAVFCRGKFIANVVITSSDHHFEANGVDLKHPYDTERLRDLGFLKKEFLDQIEVDDDDDDDDDDDEDDDDDKGVISAYFIVSAAFEAICKHNEVLDQQFVDSLSNMTPDQWREKVLNDESYTPLIPGEYVTDEFLETLMMKDALQALRFKNYYEIEGAGEKIIELMKRPEIRVQKKLIQNLADKIVLNLKSRDTDPIEDSILGVFSLEEIIRGSDMHLPLKNYYLQTPLMLAARYGHLNLVKALIKVGTSDVNHQDEYGQPALHLAAEGSYYDDQDRQIEIITALIDAGADVNGVKPGSANTVLSSAVENDNVKAAELLISKGAKLNPEPDKNGKKPIDYARSDEMRTLLDQGKIEETTSAQPQTAEKPKEDNETSLSRGIQKENKKQINTRLIIIALAVIAGLLYIFRKNLGL